MDKKNLKEMFEWADKNREEFWGEMTKELNFQFKEGKSFDKVFDTSEKGVVQPVYYPNVKMNAVDTLLMGDDETRCAIVWSREGETDEQLSVQNTKHSPAFSQDFFCRSRVVPLDSGKPKLNRISLKELRESVNQIADGLTNKLKLNVGDAIGIDMPMSWESVAIYLGTLLPPSFAPTPSNSSEAPSPFFAPPTKRKKGPSLPPSPFFYPKKQRTFLFDFV